MKTLYETTAINTRGRKGEVHSLDNIFYMEVAMPKSLGGDASIEINPKQLFAAGTSACFNSAFELVLEHDKVKVEKNKLTPTVSLLIDQENGGVKLAVEMAQKPIELAISEKKQAAITLI